MQHDTEHAPGAGHADMAAHLKTWHGFLNFMKWLVISSVILLIILAIFRTHG